MSERNRQGQYGNNRDPYLPEESNSGLMLAGTKYSAGEIIRIIMMRKWMFFVPFCVMATVAAIVSHQIPRSYQASTSFERSMNPVLDNLKIHQTAEFAVEDRSKTIRSLRDSATLRSVVEDVVKAEMLDPTQVEDNVNDLFNRMKTGLEVYVVNDSRGKSSTITIKCSDVEPKYIASVCNRLRDTYVTTARNKMQDRILEIKSFFEKQMEECKNQLHNFNESQLTRSMSEGMDLSNPQLLVEAINESRDLIKEMTQDRDSLEVQLESYIRHLDRTRQLAARNRGTSIKPGEGQTGAVVPYQSKTMLHLVDQLDTLDEDLLKQRKELRKTTRHPDVVALLRKRRILVDKIRRQQQLDAQVQAEQAAQVNNEDINALIASSASDPWQIQIAKIEMDIDLLQKNLDRNRVTLAQEEANLSHLQSLKEPSIQAFQDNQEAMAAHTRYQKDLIEYRNTVGKLNAFLSADASERAVNYRIVSQAAVPFLPKSPKPLVVVAFCLLIGLVAGVAGVLIAELGDHAFHTTRQISQTLGLPILETIDEIVTRADKARQFRRRVIYQPVLFVSLVVLMAAANFLAYISLKNPEMHANLIRQDKNRVNKEPIFPVAEMKPADLVLSMTDEKKSGKLEKE